MSDRVTLTLEPLGKTIEVDRGTSLRSVLHAYGVEFPCGGRGRCAGCRIRQVGGSLPVTGDQADILTPAELAQGWRLACRCSAENDATLEVDQWETVILADHSTFQFTPRSGLGIAVDLGTTTIVAQLLDLRSGRVLAVRTAVNPQTIHGSDVMSRIQCAIEGRQADLTDEIRRAVGALCSRLMASAKLDGTAGLDSVVIVGNSVMHHLFCAIDLAPLSRAPFEPVDKGPHRFRADDLGWTLGGDPIVRFLPCLGGFVGSDILCGVLATKMHLSTTAIVLVDLGTNGEIVVGHRERMLCASTAAGPAFEGGRISKGMRATTGAISEVAAEGGRLHCRVIGNVAPRGICGSGLVDAVAAGLDLGLIEKSGRLANGGHPIELGPHVTLTQNDIRQLQLAKAAIAAGIRLLRQRFGREACDPVPIYLAGAFGNYVNRTSARRIGLIDAPEDTIEPAGNTALLGAKMALFASDPDADAFRDLRSRIEHLPLAADPAFHQTYVEELGFPTTVRS
jgi:uncharacterized 2Fe-2S/4Fe-4S cluster protein (DUF4445 family)